MDVHAALREHFGFDAFRPGQEEVVRAAVAGRDTVAVMPTGAGKSLTYELAAMLRDGPTLVLSPLIALMKDQVDNLPPSIARAATFVNSSLAPEELDARIGGVADGSTRILFAAPERLRRQGFVELLRRVGVGLVVIDEAHCVSMWGHDFRPDYLFIRRALEQLGDPAVLGLTATATPEVEADIGVALGRTPESVRTSVVRENLRYDVEEASNAEERLEILLERLRALDGGSAIVYARSRRSTESIAITLRGHGIRAEAYHAGLEPDERSRVQEAFIADRTRVVVATTAFGMGIDKPDVRLVALVNHPDSLEGYVQMVGRAGRDGAPSDTLLLSGEADARSLRQFALGDVPSIDDLRAAYRVVRESGGVVDPAWIEQRVPDRDARVLVGMLDQAGLVRRGYDEGRSMRVEAPPAPADAGERIAGLLRRLTEGSRERAERIIRFAEADRCRHQQVAEHFGERHGGSCGACDVCSPRPASRRPARDRKPLPDDLGATIVGAVAALTWPLGRKSLVAMLRGSPAAPPSARRSEAFGVLAGAGDAEVGRWITALETAGALVTVVTEDGFRVLHADTAAEIPRLAAPRTVARTAAKGRGKVGKGIAGTGEKRASPLADDAVLDVDDGLVARLRAWRTERARADGMPPYVILHDRTLVELAAQRPRTIAELSAVPGFGPTKLERYGDAVLELCSD